MAQRFEIRQQNVLIARGEPYTLTIDDDEELASLTPRVAINDPSVQLGWVAVIIKRVQ